MRNGKNGYSTTPEFDFYPLGQKIKQAREARGVTREQLAEMLDYAPRHIQAIENEGQHPSYQLLAQLATMFNVSVDACLFPAQSGECSETRRRIDHALNQLEESELTVVAALIDGLLNAREIRKKEEHQ